MRLYIGILPPEPITERIREARRALGIEPIANPPHITLRSSFNTDSYESLVEDLRSISSEPVTITLDGYMTFADTFLVLTAQKNPELMELERQVMIISQKHRLPEEKHIHQPLEDKHLEYLRTYGDPFVLDLYTPHLTLAYSLPQQLDVETALSVPITFIAEDIALVEKPNYTIRARIDFADRSKEP